MRRLANKLRLAERLQARAGILGVALERLPTGNGGILGPIGGFRRSWACWSWARRSARPSRAGVFVAHGGAILLLTAFGGLAATIAEQVKHRRSGKTLT